MELVGTLESYGLEKRLKIIVDTICNMYFLCVVTCLTVACDRIAYSSFYTLSFGIEFFDPSIPLVCNS